MGMSDRHDDGRHDGKVVGMQVYNPATDEWLNPDDPRLPKPRRDDSGSIEMPGGWRIPKDQMPEWPFNRYYPNSILAPDITFPPVPRGGIQYPKKGTTVKNPKLAKLEAELDVAASLRRELDHRIDTLKAEIKKADLPPAPAGKHTMFSVTVQFTPNGKYYEYLLIRSGARWYTTGTKDEQKMFASWAELCGWLNSTHWHSNLGALTQAGSRIFPTEYSSQAPF